MRNIIYYMRILYRCKFRWLDNNCALVVYEFSSILSIHEYNRLLIITMLNERISSWTNNKNAYNQNHTPVLDYLHYLGVDASIFFLRFSSSSISASSVLLAYSLSGWFCWNTRVKWSISLLAGFEFWRSKASRGSIPISINNIHTSLDSIIKDDNDDNDDRNRDSRIHQIKFIHFIIEAMSFQTLLSSSTLTLPITSASSNPSPCPPLNAGRPVAGIWGSLRSHMVDPPLWRICLYSEANLLVNEYQ